MKITKYILISILLIASNPLFAQVPVNVHYIHLNELLVYVLPFYMITILGLGFFIHKLVRPNFSSRWLYICSLAGILGAAAIAYKFQEIRTTQLPSAQPSKINMRSIPIELQEQIIAREDDELKETIANYWVVAIPNFILLGLGLGIDWRDRKEKAALKN
ncbi:MAG: hypothetical protein JKY03_03765 [Aureispira sp.]|nr:hypothetical protein [Aureispira sp.]